MATMDSLKNDKNTHPTVLVLGGSGVIGRAVATEFGRQGWSVGVHYHHNCESAEETVAAILATEGDARPYQANVNNEPQRRNLFQSFVQDYGSLKLLVWAIGVAPSKLLVKTTPDEWEHVLQTNLTGAFHVLQEAGQVFKKQQDGAAIFIGSLSGEQGMAGQAAYAASKAGLLGLIRTTAQEWGHWNGRVNAVFPGWHSSPLSASGMETTVAHHTHVLHRTPSLNHMATSVYHLALAQDTSGQVWNLDSRIW